MKTRHKVLFVLGILYVIGYCQNSTRGQEAVGEYAPMVAVAAISNTTIHVLANANINGTDSECEAFWREMLRVWDVPGATVSHKVVIENYPSENEFFVPSRYKTVYFCDAHCMTRPDDEWESLEDCVAACWEDVYGPYEKWEVDYDD